MNDAFPPLIMVPSAGERDVSCLRHSVQKWSFVSPTLLSAQPPQNRKPDPTVESQQSESSRQPAGRRDLLGPYFSPRLPGAATTLHRRGIMSARPFSSTSSFDVVTPPTNFTSMEDPVVEGLGNQVGAQRQGTHPSTIFSPRRAGAQRSVGVAAHTDHPLRRRNRCSLPLSMIRQTSQSRRSSTKRGTQRQDFLVRDDAAVSADTEFPIASIPFLSTREPGETVQWQPRDPSSQQELSSDPTMVPEDVGGVSFEKSLLMGRSSLGRPPGTNRGRDPRRLADVSPTRRCARVVLIDVGVGGLLFDPQGVYVVRFDVEDLVLHDTTVLSLGDTLSYNRMQDGPDGYRAVRMVRVSTAAEEKKASNANDDSTAITDHIMDEPFDHGCTPISPPIPQPIVDDAHKRPSILRGLEYRVLLSRTDRSSTSQQDATEGGVGGAVTSRGNDALSMRQAMSPTRKRRSPLAHPEEGGDPDRVFPRLLHEGDHHADDDARLIGKQMMKICRTHPEWLLEEVEREFDEEVHRSIRRAAAAAAGLGSSEDPVSLFKQNELRATEKAVRSFMDSTEITVASERTAMEHRRREFRWYAVIPAAPQRCSRRNRPLNVFDRVAVGGVTRRNGDVANGQEDIEAGDDALAQTPSSDPTPSDDDSGRASPVEQRGGGMAEVARAFEQERRQIAQVNVRKFVDGVDLEDADRKRGQALFSRTHRGGTAQHQRGELASAEGRKQLSKSPPRVWK